MNGDNTRVVPVTQPLLHRLAREAILEGVTPLVTLADQDALPQGHQDDWRRL